MNGFIEFEVDVDCPNCFEISKEKVKVRSGIHQNVSSKDIECQNCGCKFNCEIEAKVVINYDCTIQNEE